MLEDVQHRIHQIQEIDELATLLQARDALRSVYSDMQTMWLATNNPLWFQYLRQLAGAGQELNKDIKRWYERQATLHADYQPIDDDIHRNGGSL